jgi:Mn-dependent DtxR family transcriptional regulator
MKIEEQNLNEAEKPQLNIGAVRRSYSAVTEMDVVNIILRTAEDWQGCGIIAPSNIASLLETSRYQVDKHIKSLKQKGLVQYKSIMLSSEDDYYPPYNGYCLTETGRKTFEKELKEISDRQCELIQQCFGS